MVSMGKRKFKIICYNDGEKIVYDTKIKAWFGWISFSVFYESIVLHVYSDPVEKRSMAYERINHYCKVKGHNCENIVISEVNKSQLANKDH